MTKEEVDHVDIPDTSEHASTKTKRKRRDRSESVSSDDSSSSDDNRRRRRRRRRRRDSKDSSDSSSSSSDSDGESSRSRHQRRRRRSVSSSHSRHQRNEQRGRRRKEEQQQKEEEEGGGEGNDRRTASPSPPLLPTTSSNSRVRQGATARTVFQDSWYFPISIRPLKGYTSFILAESTATSSSNLHPSSSSVSGDLSPEECQFRYQAYQEAYEYDYAEAFFDEHCLEDWFRDLYDPTRTVKNFKERQKEAQKEAVSLVNACLASPVSFLKNVCLDGEWVRIGKEREGQQQARGEHEDEEEDEEEKQEMSQFREDVHKHQQTKQRSSMEEEEEEKDRRKKQSWQPQMLEGREEEGTTGSGEGRLSLVTTPFLSSASSSSASSAFTDSKVVFIRGIPPSCPTDYFNRSIRYLTKKHPPLHIALSRPERNIFGGMERFCWLFFQTHEMAKEAVQKIHKNVIRVPAYHPVELIAKPFVSSMQDEQHNDHDDYDDHSDADNERRERREQEQLEEQAAKLEASGQPWHRSKPSHEFHLMASLYTTPSPVFPSLSVEETMTNHMNSFKRLKHDRKRAFALCALYDEAMACCTTTTTTTSFSEQESATSNPTSFYDLLQHPSCQEAIDTCVSDTWVENDAWLRRHVDARRCVLELDLAIHYLRSVHFISYYSGKGLTTKGDLMGVCPSVVCRPLLFDGENYAQKEEEEQEQEEEEETKGYLDTSIDDLHKQGEEYIAWHRMLSSDGTLSTIMKEKEGEGTDQEKKKTSDYFKRILTLCDSIEVESTRLKKRWIEERSKPEKDDHIRCLVSRCGKLFQNTSFLQKHVENKHTAQLDFGCLYPPLIRAMRSSYRSTPLLHRPLPFVRIEREGNTKRVRFPVFYAQVHGQQGSEEGDQKQGHQSSTSFSSFLQSASSSLVNPWQQYQHHHHPVSLQPSSTATSRFMETQERAEDKFIRKPLFAYEDIDAPSTDQTKPLSFGVSVVPKKKKRRLFKKK